MSRVLLIEWSYLSEACKTLAKEYMICGIKDIETAVELAINELGEECAFELDEVV